MNEIKKYYLVRCSKKTGKIDMTMEAHGKGVMGLWALQNTTKTKMTFIIEADTGNIEALYTGTADGFPKIEKNAGNIEEYCEGLLDALKEGASA